MIDLRSDVASFEVVTPLGDAPGVSPTLHPTPTPPLPGTTTPLVEGR